MEGLLTVAVLVGLFFILPKRIEAGTTEKDLFQLDFTLSYDDRCKIIEEREKSGAKNVYCSACESPVEISFLRRNAGQYLKQAICLPCFLRDYTNVDQEDIDRLVLIAEKQGWYVSSD